MVHHRPISNDVPSDRVCRLRHLLVERVWHSYTLVSLTALLLLLIAALRIGGDGEINNYRIFQGSWHHLCQLLSLYAEYPDEYYDVFLYGPSFSLLIAPFAALPLRVGAILWVFVGTAVIWLTARRLLPGFGSPRSTVFLWIVLNELFLATLMEQYNLLLAGLLLLSFVFVEQDKPGWAALMIAVGTLTKVYGAVGLLLFPFVKRKRAFLLWGMVWMLVVLLAPAVLTGPEYLMEQYKEWIEALSRKNGCNHFALMQNMGLLGMVRKGTRAAGYSDLLLMVPAGLLLLSPLVLRVRSYSARTFRTLFFAGVMLFVVLFSTGTESNTYIIGYIGVALWWVTTCEGRPHKWYDLTLLVGAMIFSQTTSDLFPRVLRQEFLLPYAVKALFPTLIWFRIQWLLLTEQWETKEEARGGY